MTLVTRLLPAAIIFASLCGAARADGTPLPPKGAATFAIYLPAAYLARMTSARRGRLPCRRLRASQRALMDPRHSTIWWNSV